MRDTASQDQLELARDDPEERTEYQEPDEPELDEPEDGNRNPESENKDDDRRFRFISAAASSSEVSYGISHRLNLNILYDG